MSIQESLWSRASAATGSSVAPIWPLEGHFMVDGLCSRNHCRCNCKLIKNHICCTTKTTTEYIATRWRHDLQWSRSTTVDALIQDAEALPQRWWSDCRRNAYTIPPMSAIKIFVRWGCRFLMFVHDKDNNHHHRCHQQHPNGWHSMRGGLGRGRASPFRQNLPLKQSRAVLMEP